MCTLNQFPCVFGHRHVISLMKMSCVTAHWLGLDLIQFYCENDVKGMNIEYNAYAFYVSEIEKTEDLLVWPKTCLKLLHPTTSLYESY